MPYIYSTLTSTMDYCTYVSNSPNESAIIDRKITIKGGANNIIAKTLITPKGAATKVTDEELVVLKTVPLFQLHVKKGFLTIDKAKEKVEKMVKNMQAKDGSAPRTPADYVKGEDGRYKAGRPMQVSMN